MKIYIIDYNKLGFDTYRVYMPYMTQVDCYDIDDLKINQNYDELKQIYTNILNANEKQINTFIDIFLPINRNLKYDYLVSPTDLFHITGDSDYYKLDFTSLLIILCILQNRKKEIYSLLKFKLNNFILNDKKN